MALNVLRPFLIPSLALMSTGGSCSGGLSILSSKVYGANIALQKRAFRKDNISFIQNNWLSFHKLCFIAGWNGNTFSQRSEINHVGRCVKIPIMEKTGNVAAVQLQLGTRTPRFLCSIPE